MSKPVVLMIGKYENWDLEDARAQFALTELSGPDAIAGLSEEQRASFTAVAYKGHYPFGGAQMDLLPNIKLIANFGVGYDAIDVKAASARGIRVTNTPDVLNDDVADVAVGMLLAFSRRLPQYEAWLMRGDWAAKGEPPLARKFSGRRAGIMGLGRIGREIADRMAAFKMEIHYHSRSKKDTPEGWIWHETPEALAANSDYLVVALVGGKETEGYVSRKVLEQLDEDAVICNISRGSTIDEGAMLDMLEAGRIRGAALDVFRAEPDLDPRFLKLDNVHLQPHMGSATRETRQGMGQLQRANILAMASGQPLLTAVN